MVKSLASVQETEKMNALWPGLQFLLPVQFLLSGDLIDSLAYRSLKIIFDIRSFCFFLLCTMAGVWRFEWRYCNKPPSNSVLLHILAGSSVLCVCAQSLPTLTPWTVARKAPLSMGFPRQKCRSGLPFPTPGDLPTQQANPRLLFSPALAGSFFTTGAIWKALSVLYFCTKENRSTINAQCHLISVVSYSNPMDLFHYKMLFHYVFTSLCLSKFVIYLFCSSQLCATNNCIDSSMQKSNQRNLKF